MKDFIKWLGVNEKVAKIVVWIFISMILLITTNTLLSSIGFPHYMITVDNLAKIKINKMLEVITPWIIILFNFYTIVLLVFRAKDTKKIIKYSLLYLVLNIIVRAITDYALTQIFIISYIIIFCYLFSNRNKKYILYAIESIILNILIQSICYLYKLKLIDILQTSNATKILLSLDYFIVMGIIILVKEIILKKRSEKECLENGEEQAYSGLESSTKKLNSLKK